MARPSGHPQRRSNGNGGWLWKLGDTPRVLYRLPEILAAGANEWVFVAEGEKDVNRLASVDLIATCNPGGASNWTNLSDDTALNGRRVAVIGHAPALLNANCPRSILWNRDALPLSRASRIIAA